MRRLTNLDANPVSERFTMSVSGVSAALSYARSLAISPEPRDGDVEHRPAASGGGSAPGAEAPAQTTAADQATTGSISSEDVTSSRAKANLLALANSLGTDPDTLLAHLSSGQSIRSLAAAGGESGYGASIAPAGGIAIDQYV
jgi:hypothetical protein